MRSNDEGFGGLVGLVGPLDSSNDCVLIGVE